MAVINNRLVKASAAAFALAFCGVAQAEDISYDYIGVSWVFGDELETEGVAAVAGGAADVEAGGWFEGSGEFFPMAFLSVSGSTLKMDTAADFGSTGMSFFSVGVGGYLPVEAFLGMQQRFHLTGEVSYERLHFIDQTDGWGAKVGARWKPIDQLEVNGNIGWRDYGTFVGEDLADWVYELGVAVRLTERLALTGDWQRLDFELGDGDFELNTFRVGARWNF
jgi:hypothetical protein